MSDELITNERAMEFDRQVSQVFAKLRPCNFSQEEFRGEVGGLLMRLEYAHMTAATQAQAAAERAEAERDEARAKLEALTQSYRETRAVWPEGYSHEAWAKMVSAAEARAASLEALLPWAMNQMRRAARTIELLAVGGTLNNEHGKNLYSDGLDQCADAIEALSPAAAPGDETETYTTPPRIVDFASGTGALGNPPVDASAPGERP